MDDFDYGYESFMAVDGKTSVLPIALGLAGLFAVAGGVFYYIHNKPAAGAAPTPTKGGSKPESTAHLPPVVPGVGTSPAAKAPASHASAPASHTSAPSTKSASAPAPSGGSSDPLDLISGIVKSQGGSLADSGGFSSLGDAAGVAGGDSGAVASSVGSALSSMFGGEGESVPATGGI